MPAEQSCGNNLGEGNGLGVGDQSPHSEVAPPKVIGRKSAITVPESIQRRQELYYDFFAFLLIRNFHQCGYHGHTEFVLAL